MKAPGSTVEQFEAFCRAFEAFEQARDKYRSRPGGRMDESLLDEASTLAERALSLAPTFAEAVAGAKKLRLPMPFSEGEYQSVLDGLAFVADPRKYLATHATHATTLNGKPLVLSAFGSGTLAIGDGIDLVEACGTENVRPVGLQ